jgi:glutathione S-transferase
LRINPHGKVPALVDDDFALPESDAILFYLAEKDPGAKLLPRFDGTAGTTQARAQILRFCDMASTAFYPAYSEWWNATNNSDPAKRSPEAADTALVKVKRGLDVLEKTLAAGEHLVGEFSLADVTNVSILFSLKRRLGMDPLVGHERVKGWYERVTARPAWETVAAE